MSNQIASENQAYKSDSTEASYSKSKHFQFPFSLIEYRNIEERIQDNNIFQQEVQIKNYTCQQKQGKYIKTTLIKWRNQTLKITDQYCVGQTFCRKQRLEQDVTNFQTKRFNYSQPNNSDRKDTKNLIKNLINLFSKWLRVEKPSDYQEVQQLLKQAIEKNTYYNKILINSISDQISICRSFLDFCENDAENMIKNSRINDKKCHIKALKNYKKYFEQKIHNFELSRQKSHTVPK